MANDTPFPLMIDALKAWEDFTIVRRGKSLRGSTKSPGWERRLFSRNVTVTRHVAVLRVNVPMCFWYSLLNISQRE